MTARHWWLLAAALLVLLAFFRPLDHDESQYVAAAVLTADGWLPYRDYAYLQTPLQPFVLAPVAAAAGRWAWPALRVANAALGALAIAGVHRAAREVAPARAALAAAALFAACDAVLFAAGTARNDALPLACLAGALPAILRAEGGRGTRAGAVLAGALLAAAAAAKVSYAIPAAAYGVWALARARRHRPGWVALGALPAAALVAWTAALSPLGFLFGTLTFPAAAPADYYADRPWKLSGAAKLVDTLKFLALGPALPALGLVATRRRRPALLAVLTLAGIVAALGPTPTWRQYLLPALPPLFVLLAWGWRVQGPGRRTRWAFAAFVAAGVAPTAAALATARAAMPEALRQGAAIRAAMDRARVTGPVATLSPQFLPATGRRPDPRFALGPFFFRGRRLHPPGGEDALHLLSRAHLATAALPRAVLVGGEGAWTSGDATLDTALEARARAIGMRAAAVGGGRFRLYVR